MFFGYQHVKLCEGTKNDSSRVFEYNRPEGSNYDWMYLKRNLFFSYRLIGKYLKYGKHYFLQMN